MNVTLSLRERITAREFRHKRELKKLEGQNRQIGRNLRREGEVEQILARRRALQKTRQKIAAQHGTDCDCRTCKAVKAKDRHLKSKLRRLFR